ncbi:iron-containing alcohol dehydrogenase [Thioclava sp. FR2]|uniref:iron-containing alcohol dehydrogenase n=1 Tax=Thioclava sp. FR2 TaxID=3445780 RepID=UPI003EBACD41
MSFSIQQPPRILFGRGTSAKATKETLAFGKRVLFLHGRSMERSDWLVDSLTAGGAEVQRYLCYGEPTLAMLEEALRWTKEFEPQVVLALGGGSVLDLGKALAALIPAPGGVMDHLEVVGKALPLARAPLPFIAIPTTAGTGAEVTKNAVIGLPDLGRKVSLRDDRMIARVAIVDPALTDGCPRDVTLASGLDAVTQVIEPYLSCRATAYSDQISAPTILPGMTALVTLMQREDAKARDDLAWTSLCGGLALANSGLGAVHGLAGVIGGMTGAAHGAICGALLGPVLAVNRQRCEGLARDRVEAVARILGACLGCDADEAPLRLSDWAHAASLPRLSAMGLAMHQHTTVATAAQDASSMKGNPVPLSIADLCEIMSRAG